MLSNKEKTIEDDEELKEEIVKLKNRINKVKIPNKLVIFKNADKEFHELWTPGRDMGNIPHPFRAIISAVPNSGKTLIIKNLILRQQPAFEEIFLIHIDGEYTQEYSDIIDDDFILDDIPNPKEWQGEVKTLVILEDLSYKDMNKFQKESLKRLWGYVSTHKNISCALTTQDIFELPPIVRRCSNILILFPSFDYTSISLLSKKVGLKKGDLENLFRTFCQCNHDFIMLDLTSNTPYPIRYNMFQKINKNI